MLTRTWEIISKQIWCSRNLKHIQWGSILHGATERAGFLVFGLGCLWLGCKLVAFVRPMLIFATSCPNCTFPYILRVSRNFVLGDLAGAAAGPCLFRHLETMVLSFCDPFMCFVYQVPCGVWAMHCMYMILLESCFAWFLSYYLEPMTFALSNLHILAIWLLSERSSDPFELADVDPPWWYHQVRLNCYWVRGDVHQQFRLLNSLLTFTYSFCHSYSL